MFSRFRKKYQKEDGAYMVITALLLVAVIGMMALAVDQGSWLSQKRSEQNAVDAAAVAAAQVYAGGGSAGQAVDAAVTAANNNGIVVTASDIAITTDNAVSPKKVKAVLTLDADNYFYNNGTAKNKTSVTVSSEAEIYETQTSGGSYIINPAIEAKTLVWGYGNSLTTIQGDVATSNSLTFNSPVTVNGNINADGIINMTAPSPCTIHGNVNSKDNIYISIPNIIDGNLESMKAIQWNSYDGTVKGAVRANGNISLNKMTINGNVESHGGIISFIGPGEKIGGNIISDTGITINGGNYPSIVDGIFYTTNFKLQNYQKNGMKKSDGSDVDFREYNGEKVAPVTHQDYVWKWDCLLKTPDISYHVTDADINEFACSSEVMSKYGQYSYLGGGIPLAGFSSGGNAKSLTFKNAAIFQMFINFVQNKAASATQPIYFPGSISIYNDGPKSKVQGFIVAEGDIDYEPPCDFSGYSTSFLSMNGNITLGNAGPADITGAIICLNKDKNVKISHNGGIIHGGVISHGDLTMNGAWSIITDQNWQKYVPISGGTKTIKKVKLVS